MSQVPHELRQDFPEFAEKITMLKTTDDHFRKLAEDYHHLNREVHRIEVGVEATSDMASEEIRKKRMLLKDTLYTYLKDH